MSRTIQLRSLLAAAVLLGIPTTAAAQMYIAPPMVFMSDAERFGTFLVANRTAEPQEVQISFRFGYPVSDTAGAMSMVYGDTLPAADRSMQAWVRAFPRQFILQPGQQQTIRLSARPPEDISEGVYWTRLVTTSNPRSPQVDTIGEDVRAQIVFRVEQVTTVLFSRGRPAPQPRVGDPQVVVGRERVAVVTPLVIGGSAPFLGQITVRLRGPDGRVVAERVESAAAYVDMIRRFEFERASLPPGEYTAEVTLDPNRSDIPSEDRIAFVPVSEQVRFLVE